MAEPRIVVVGAGPAGVRCAEALVQAGLRPMVIDEGRRDGGQIYRRQPDNFRRPYAKLYGTEAARAEALHRSFDALRPSIDYRPETLVWNIAAGEVHTASAGRQDAAPYDALVLCTGAIDRLAPVPGWQRAGAYSLGAAQIALKAQACAVGRAVVFLGSGPLLYLVAAQYSKAGVQVAAVLDTAGLGRRIAALPKLLARPAALWNGVGLTLALQRAGVPVLSGVRPVEILGGADREAACVVVADAQGRERRFACDAVAMGWHLRPETQLADLARCEFRFDARSRQWVPQRDPLGRSSVPRVYLAGDGAYVLGAGAAEIAGRLAAAAVLEDLGRPRPAETIARLQRELGGWDRFAQGLREAFPWPAAEVAAVADAAVVCRCEAVTAGELRRVVLETGAAESNRAKAFSRVGMGRCQGRYCGHAGAEIIARAAGAPLESVGRLRGQAPVKPLPIDIAPAPL
jgi:NADPH-dependent 2,4-dienoyl-CoA reductase/sulfur reductase-like enzyme